MSYRFDFPLILKHQYWATGERLQERWADGLFAVATLFRPPRHLYCYHNALGNIVLPDRHKARTNLRKHGLSFEEGQSVFFDENGGSLNLSSPRHARRRTNVSELSMRDEYDFSKSRKNPYSKQLKRQITIRLDAATVDYFKELGTELGIPYQNLINLYLRDCATQKSRPIFQVPPRQVLIPAGGRKK